MKTRTTNNAEQLTAKEHKERERLHFKWATMRATKREILRCMELDRRAK